MGRAGKLEVVLGALTALVTDAGLGVWPTTGGGIGVVGGAIFVW